MATIEELTDLLMREKEKTHEHSDAWAFVDKLFTLLEDKWQGPLPDIITMYIYAIQSSARTEGAEAERERIRNASTHYAEGELIEGVDAETMEGEAAYTQYEFYITPAPLLAPKEKK